MRPEDIEHGHESSTNGLERSDASSRPRCRYHEEIHLQVPLLSLSLYRLLEEIKTKLHFDFLKTDKRKTNKATQIVHSFERSIINALLSQLA